jgi:hypothetical protein
MFPEFGIQLVNVWKKTDRKWTCVVDQKWGPHGGEVDSAVVLASGAMQIYR